MPMPFNFCAEKSSADVDMDILVTASAEIQSTSSAVQRQASADGQYPVLQAAVSAMYSVLSWTKKLNRERNE